MTDMTDAQKGYDLREHPDYYEAMESEEIERDPTCEDAFDDEAYETDQFYKERGLW